MDKVLGLREIVVCLKPDPRRSFDFEYCMSRENGDFDRGEKENWQMPCPDVNIIGLLPNELLQRKGELRCG